MSHPPLKNMEISSDVDVCNAALQMLGLDPITSLTDETTEADFCNLHYPIIRNSYLQSYSWRFATGQQQLSLTADTPLFGWTYVFQLPTNMLRLEKISASALAFDIQGKKLLCNADEVYIEALFELGEENYPDYFLEALILKFAAHAALPLMEDADKAKELGAQFSEANLRARRTDAWQHPPKKIPDSHFKLVTVRA